jgi:hypothetical protein
MEGVADIPKELFSFIWRLDVQVIDTLGQFDERTVEERAISVALVKESTHTNSSLWVGVTQTFITRLH